MSVIHESGCSIEFLDDAEAEITLDRIARAKMGISIVEFRSRCRRGAYDGIDWDTVPGLVDVAILAGVES